MRMVAETAAIRSPIPRMSARPTPSMASMNRVSTTGDPESETKKARNGPTSTWPRKPLVGEPPLIQAFAAGVE
jgi:hypothetical protein